MGGLLLTDGAETSIDAAKKPAKWPTKTWRPGEAQSPAPGARAVTVKRKEAWRARGGREETAGLRWPRRIVTGHSEDFLFDPISS